jgi:hypothetical protein
MSDKPIDAREAEILRAIILNLGVLPNEFIKRENGDCRVTAEYLAFDINERLKKWKINR